MRRVVGQVEAQRRHGDLIRGQRLHVGARLRREAAALEHQPIIWVAAPVLALVDAHQLGVAPSLARDGDAGDLARRAGREVDVDQDARRDADRQRAPNEVRTMLLRALPMHRLMPLGAAIGLAERDGGDAHQRALHGPGDGAGIGDVLGDVLAAVDARQDQVRLAALHDLAHAHDDAVGRRAAHREMARADLAQAQGIVERERMRDARLVALGRDDEDVVGKLGGDGLEHFEARRMDAVVVGEQDAHGAGRRIGSSGYACAGIARLARAKRRALNPAAPRPSYR